MRQLILKTAFLYIKKLHRRMVMPGSPARGAQVHEGQFSGVGKTGGQSGDYFLTRILSELRKAG